MNLFMPSRSHAEGLRGAMDLALWESVRSLPGMDKRAAANPRRASPLDYGAYSDLVLHIPAWQSVPDGLRDEARDHLYSQLDGGDHGERDQDSLPRIRNFSTSDYSPAQLDRISRWMTTEEANNLGLAASSDAVHARVQDHIVRALGYLEKAAPELFGEIITLVQDFIVVTPDNTQRFEFTAGTSFAVWGAIVVNAELIQDWTEAYNMLAHEAGHLLLFAIARKEPLVLNASNDVFQSPVRDDPRPMDGIFHAAFVASREAWAFDRLLAWAERTDGVSDEDRQLAEESLEASVIVFWQAVEALENDARLTCLGQAVLEDCKDFMRMNFALVTE